MTLRIIADSTADLDAATAKAFRIAIVPLTVYFGDQAYLDGIELTSAEFFSRLPNANPLPRTAAPAPGAFLEVFNQLAGEADEILCVTISEKLSGTANAARAARELFREPRRIDIVDSLGTTAATANIAVTAAHAAKAGLNLETASRIARSAAERQKILIGLETLQYLQRGGRIGRARAFLGGILNVKPLLTLREGEVAPAVRVRSRARMEEQLYQFAVSHREAELIRIVHAAAAEDCERLAERVRGALPGVPVATGWIGPAVGVYTGPGALGVALIPKGEP